MRMGRLGLTLVAGLALCCPDVIVGAAYGATNRVEKAYGGYVFDEFRWVEGPSNWPKGVQMAVLQSSPTKVGPYTVRYKLPAGYIVPPHWCSTDQGITVMSGVLNVGMPPSYDKANSKKVGAGSYAFIPARLRHSIWTDEETVIQVHGNGPVQFTNLFSEQSP